LEREVIGYSVISGPVRRRVSERNEGAAVPYLGATGDRLLGDQWPGAETG